VNAVSNRTMGPLVMLVWALVIVVTVAFWPRWWLVDSHSNPPVIQSSRSTSAMAPDC
jgi:hypothetical protein